METRTVFASLTCWLLTGSDEDPTLNGMTSKPSYREPIERSDDQTETIDGEDRFVGPIQRVVRPYSSSDQQTLFNQRIHDVEGQIKKNDDLILKLRGDA